MHRADRGPARELPDQIEDDARLVGKHLDFPSPATTAARATPSRSAHCRGACAGRSAPGRLEDFAEQSRLDLRKVGVVVIDEADRMFDMGFIPDLRCRGLLERPKAVECLRKGEQSLFGSYGFRGPTGCI